VKRNFKKEFETTKKIRLIAIGLYLIAPIPSLLQGTSLNKLAFPLVGLLTVAAFVTSFQYKCPSCGSILHIFTSPKKEIICGKCKCILA